MNNSTKTKILPFSLTALVILLDQGAKAFIVRNWSLEGWSSLGRFIKDVFGNDFLHIVHVRNKAIAFSLGHNLPENLRPFLFIIAPLLVLGFLIWYYMSSKDFNTLQRGAVAGIIGGGLGNIIDRIFRPDGVVDFISVKFYGLLGMDRWPTFNIADSSVVVCCIIFLISIVIGSRNSGTEAAA
ncbi:MAG: signal peptidase II [Treponema sp.]|jgi:signal peptidase II|nr:signal peptidase II [Treponema sp.]